nr:hypothetical protein L203_03398 [Cryptococcus depauperatus CBS 7841]
MTEGNSTKTVDSRQEDAIRELLRTSPDLLHWWLNGSNNPNSLVLKSAGYEDFSRSVASSIASVYSGLVESIKSALNDTRGALTSVGNEASHICSWVRDGLSISYRGQSPGLSSYQSRLSWKQPKPCRKKQPKGSHNITVKNLSIAAVALLGLMWDPKTLQERRQDKKMFG